MRLMGPEHFTQGTCGNLTGETVDVHFLPLMIRTGHLSSRWRRREGAAERERERKHLQTPVRSHHTSACCLCSPRLLVEVVADFLLVDVDDVLHQQVPLEAVDSVAIQHHLVSAGRTAETPAVHQHGGASLEQRRLERKKIYQNINNTMMVLPFKPPRLPVNAKQLEVVVIQHSCMLGFQ